MNYIWIDTGQTQEVKTPKQKPCDRQGNGIIPESLGPLLPSQTGRQKARRKSCHGNQDKKRVWKQKNLKKNK